MSSLTTAGIVAKTILPTHRVSLVQQAKHIEADKQQIDFLDEAFIEHFAEAVHARANQYGVNSFNTEISEDNKTVILSINANSYYQVQQVSHAAMDAITRFTGIKYDSQENKLRVQLKANVVPAFRPIYKSDAY